MANVRIATFNCENLFARFKFNKDLDPEKASKDGFSIDKLSFTLLNEEEKKLTARAIKEADADIVALQEVDNHEVLRRFRNDFLKSEKYVHTLLIDGNDPRHIDVALLSRYPIVHARSYHHLRAGTKPLFSRDCLEADVAVDGKPLTLYINHYKAMLGGRAETKAKRVRQAEATRQLVIDRFGANAGDAPWVICGDLNDFIDGHEGISAVTGWDQVENVVDRIPNPEDRWTHFFDREKEYRQLDYLLVSKSLAATSAAAPELIRKGLSTKATQYTGPRFPGVTNKQEASDHCPLVWEASL